MNAAMEEVLNSTRKRSEAHNELSQVLSTDVKAMLDQMQVEALTNARKCHVWISSIQVRAQEGCSHAKIWTVVIGKVWEA